MWRYCATLSWKPNVCRHLLISHFIFARWTIKGAISSTWPCRTPTLKASCSSSASKLMSIPGSRTQPNSPPSTWLSRQDPRSLSATWCAFYYWSSPVQTLDNSFVGKCKAACNRLSPIFSPFVFSCLLEPKLMSWPNTGRQHYIWLPSRILPQFALCCWKMESTLLPRTRMETMVTFNS